MKNEEIANPIFQLIHESFIGLFASPYFHTFSKVWIAFFTLITDHSQKRRFPNQIEAFEKVIKWVS